MVPFLPFTICWLKIVPIGWLNQHQKVNPSKQNCTVIKTKIGFTKQSSFAIAEY